MLALLISALLSAEPVDAGTVDPRVHSSTVACQTVADCWLDEEGGPIARPKKLKGKALPSGDCGRNLRWLRNRLTCSDHVCVATHVGDRC